MTDPRFENPHVQHVAVTGYGKLAYQSPTHPDADSAGWVLYNATARPPYAVKAENRRRNKEARRARKLARSRQ